MEGVYSVNTFLIFCSIHPSYIDPVFPSSFYGVSVNYVTVTIIRPEILRSPVIYHLSGKLTLWQAGRQADVNACLSDFKIFVLVTIFPVAKTNVWQHYFVQ
jgi:hypothetical protein